MKKYAVIQLNGAQYKITPGDKFLVDKTEKLTEPKVLLFVDGDKRKIGDPTVKDVKVNLKILEQVRQDKVVSAKFKAKSRYRRKIGFRASKTLVEVKSIS